MVMRKKQVQHAYMEPEKVMARERALGHAVDLLTARRTDAAVVGRKYVRAVKQFLIRNGSQQEVEVANLCTDRVIKLWEALWDNHLGRKNPGDLTIAYLAGPNPLNDFRTLVKMGVHPYNIWAFESDSGLFNAALREIKASEFPLLKIYSGTLDTFLVSVPRSFDIIYIDACGPLPSIGQATLRLISNVFRHARLCSPGVLITNFAKPDMADDAQQVAYGELITAYMYPKGIVESGNAKWNMDEGPQAYGLVPRSDDVSESFYHRVLAGFDDQYGQYITRQIFDLGSFIAPWIRIANAPIWSTLFKVPANKAAGLVEKLRHFNDEGDGGDFISEADLHPLNWTLSAMLNALPNTVDVNYLEMSPQSKKLRDRWLTELSGFPIQACSPCTALEAYEVLRGELGRDLRTTDFEDLLEHDNYFRRMPMFCDVPNPELSFFSIIGQFAFPMHYNVPEVRRYSYVASGKSTRMFLDVIPFDTCRYIYDWLPTLELVNDSFDLAAQQLVYRFALDGLTKHTIRYNEEYFYGTTVVGVNEDGFTEKLLIPRVKI
jgi:hypothetical protein